MVVGLVLLSCWKILGSVSYSTNNPNKTIRTISRPMAMRGNLILMFVAEDRGTLRPHRLWEVDKNRGTALHGELGCIFKALQ